MLERAFSAEVHSQTGAAWAADDHRAQLNTMPLNRFGITGPVHCSVRPAMASAASRHHASSSRGRLEDTLRIAVQVTRKAFFFALKVCVGLPLSCRGTVLRKVTAATETGFDEERGTSSLEPPLSAVSNAPRQVTGSRYRLAEPHAPRVKKSAPAPNRVVALGLFWAYFWSFHHLLGPPLVIGRCDRGWSVRKIRTSDLRAQGRRGGPTFVEVGPWWLVPMSGLVRGIGVHRSVAGTRGAQPTKTFAPDCIGCWCHLLINGA